MKRLERGEYYGMVVWVKQRPRKGTYMLKIYRGYNWDDEIALNPVGQAEVTQFEFEQCLMDIRPDVYLDGLDFVLMEENACFLVDIISLDEVRIYATGDVPPDVKPYIR